MRARVQVSGRLMLALLAVTTLVGATSATAVSAEGAGQPEIVGGVPAAPGEYPYQVALVHRLQDIPALAQFCGGSLISPDTVLTAAHCMPGETSASVDVRSGIVDLVADQGHRAHVRQIRVHPGYDPHTSDNDLAILQLDRALPETPVQIAQTSQTALWAPGTAATITGWGDTTGNRDFSTVLREAEVPVLADPACTAAYGSEFFAGHMLCAGLVDLGGVDTCQGDSGGPIVVDNAGSPLQIGATSFGEGCALPDFPGVYTRLDTYFTPFIERFLDPDSAPDAPRSVRAGSAFAVARVTWVPPFFDGGTRITGYRLTFSPGGRVVSVAGSARAANVAGLARGVRYTVNVKALNAVGAGPSAATSVRIP